MVYTPGNHDFWWNRGEDRYTIYDQMARGRNTAARLGIRLLMDIAVILQGVRFLGGPLWTDMRLSSRGWTHASRSAAGRNGMSDDRRIRKLASPSALSVLASAPPSR